jgi:hypothetical protein
VGGNDSDVNTLEVTMLVVMATVDNCSGPNGNNDDWTALNVAVAAVMVGDGSGGNISNDNGK